MSHFKKGSPEAKRYMARLRKLADAKRKGTLLRGPGYSGVTGKALRGDPGPIVMRGPGYTAKRGRKNPYAAVGSDVDGQIDSATWHGSESSARRHTSSMRRAGWKVGVAALKNPVDYQAVYSAAQKVGYSVQDAARVASEFKKTGEIPTLVSAQLKYFGRSNPSPAWGDKRAMYREYGYGENPQKKADPLDALIGQAWHRLGFGVQVPIMDIPKIFQDVRAEVRAGNDLDTAIRAVIAHYRAAERRNPPTKIQGGVASNPHIVLDSADDKILHISRGDPMRGFSKAYDSAKRAAFNLNRDVHVVAHPYVPSGWKTGTRVTKLFYAGGPYVSVTPSGDVVQSNPRKQGRRFAGPDMAQSFKVAAVTSNQNSFGLWGTTIIAQNGDAYEIGLGDMRKREVGDVIRVPLVDLGAGKFSLNFALIGAEIPRKLDPKAPPSVVAAVWGLKNPLTYDESTRLRGTQTWWKRQATESREKGLYHGAAYFEGRSEQALEDIERYSGRDNPCCNNPRPHRHARNNPVLQTVLLASGNPGKFKMNSSESAEVVGIEVEPVMKTRGQAQVVSRQHANCFSVYFRLKSGLAQWVKDFKSPVAAADFARDMSLEYGVRVTAPRLGKKYETNPRRSHPNPEFKIPWKVGQEVPVDEARKVVVASGDKEWLHQFDAAYKLQCKANRAPKTCLWNVISVGSPGKIDAYSAMIKYGDTDETYYKPPKGSKKGSHLYRHLWGEGRGKKKPVPLLVSADGKTLVHPLGPGQTAKDWLRG